MIETNACLQSRAEFYAEGLGVTPNPLIGPVYRQKSSRVENSIIGPNVAIGENCTINGSMIRNTIVDDDSCVSEATLEHSLLGRSSTAIGQAAQMIVADGAKIRMCYSGEETFPADQGNAAGSKAVSGTRFTRLLAIYECLLFVFNLAYRMLRIG